MLELTESTTPESLLRSVVERRIKSLPSGLRLSSVGGAPSYQLGPHAGALFAQYHLVLDAPTSIDDPEVVVSVFQPGSVGETCVYLALTAFSATHLGAAQTLFGLAHEHAQAVESDLAVVFP